MKILYAEDEDDLRAVISVSLEGKIDCEVIEARSGNEAISLLKDHHDVDLIISDYFMDDGNGAMLYEFKKQHKYDIPFIVLTANPEVVEKDEIFKSFNQDDTRNKIYEKPCSINDLINYISSIMEDKISSSPQEYCKVKIHRFLKANKFEYALFIKLSSSKYVRIGNPDQQLCSEDIEKYMNRGVKYLFIKNQDFEDFSNFYFMMLENLVSDNKIPDEQKPLIQNETVSMIHERIMGLGISQEVVNTMDKVNDSIIYMIKQCNSQQLLNLIQKAKENGGYVHQHSIMTSYIAGAIAMRMNWKTDTTLQKIGMASILHDVVFVEDEDLARIDIIDDHTHKTFNHKEVEKIRKHPATVSKMIKNAKNLLPNLEVIILNHHEKPDGSGFPRGLNYQHLSQISCLFILAETFINKIYDEKIDQNFLEKTLTNLEDKYNVGTFKKPFEGLNTVIRT